MIKVRKRDAFKVGKTSFSRNRGFASINFLSSTSIMLRADLVSPYLDNCSFSLHHIKNPKLDTFEPEIKTSNPFNMSLNPLTIPFQMYRNRLPEVLKSQKMCDFLVQVFVKSREHFQILHQYLNCLSSVLPELISKLQYPQSANTIKNSSLFFSC